MSPKSRASSSRRPRRRPPPATTSRASGLRCCTSAIARRITSTLYSGSSERTLMTTGASPPGLAFTLASGSSRNNPSTPSGIVATRWGDAASSRIFSAMYELFEVIRSALARV